MSAYSIILEGMKQALFCFRFMHNAHPNAIIWVCRFLILQICGKIEGFYLAASIFGDLFDKFKNKEIIIDIRAYLKIIKKPIKSPSCFLRN
jgi:hypothetical protein